MKRFVSILIASVALLGTLGVATSAFAYQNVMKPSAVSGGYSTIKVQYWTDEGRLITTRSFKASPTRTVFRITTGESTSANVSFSKFRSYVFSSGSGVWGLRWQWKTIGGKRVRYLNYIYADNYHG